MKSLVTLLLISLSASTLASEYYYPNPYYPWASHPATNQNATAYQYPRYTYPTYQNPGTQNYGNQYYNTRNYDPQSYNIQSYGSQSYGAYRPYYQRTYPGQYYRYPAPAPSVPAQVVTEQAEQQVIIKQPDIESVVIKTPKQTITVRTKQKTDSQQTQQAFHDDNPESQKQRFFNQILPLVVNENNRILKTREQLQALLKRLDQGQYLASESSSWLKQLARKYRVNGNIISQTEAQQELLRRVNIIAPAMALAQAANESAWGTSRFSKQGNNLFGIWTYDPDIGIKPLKRDPDKKHFVRKFDSFQDSVTYYIHTLNTHAAYKTLRDIRHKSIQEGRVPSGYELAQGLEKYSAKGQEYIRLIKLMINNNDLDNIQLLEMAAK